MSFEAVDESPTRNFEVMPLEKERAFLRLFSLARSWMYFPN